MKSYNFYKWRIWIILAFSFVLSLFHRGAMGVISSSMSVDLNASASEISNIASVTFYTYAFMQIPAGVLLDRYGYRKISCIGMLLTGLGSILLGITPSTALAYIGRLFVGLGTSVIFISILKAQSIWFSKREFTKASGLLSFIGNIGGVLATFPLAFLVAYIGWRFSMIGMGVICVLLFGLIFLYVKNHPNEYGYEAQGDSKKSEKINLKQSFKTVIFNASIWRNFFALFTLVGCTTAFSGVWGVNYLTTVYQITETKASFYISFILIGLIIGSLCINKVLTWFNHQIVLCQRTASVLMTICWVYFLIIEKGKPNLSLLPILLFLMGFLATTHILSFTDITHYCKSNNSGLASSFINAGEFIASSVITLFIGTFLDLTYTGPMINGVRYYSSNQYQTCFFIFLFISALGILTSFIKTKQEQEDFSSPIASMN